jgi:hypothetical protein
MRRATCFASFFAFALALAGDARAWEADTTHAGLTEQSATNSKLHDRLRNQFGTELGLYGKLTVPPDDAPALFEVIEQLNPTHGYVPDARGRQSALAWLVAGSVIADMPVAAARNHFFDPSKGIGLVIPSGLPGPFAGKRLALSYVGKGDAVPAVDWIESADNPLNVAGFFAQYRKAVVARTPGERERHLAGTLVAAGAVLHVLQDMGSPSHVRNDFGSHLTPLSDEPTDVGSRFERVAALAFGRLGVAAAARAIERDRVRDFFFTAEGTGLANWTATSFFSGGTLPKSVEVPRRARANELEGAITAALRLPYPAPLAAGLDLIRAGKPGGATLVDADGVCLARYRTRDFELRWKSDDDCALEQIETLLPEVSAYSTGLLQFLFRGSLAISKNAGGAIVVSAADVEFGEGTITVFWDDASGVRTAVGEGTATTGGTIGASLAQLDAPGDDARFVAALFEGVDANGEKLIATGLLSLTE